MDEIPQRETEIEGSLLSYVDAGQGPPLLLGHGYLWDWQMWLPQMPVLSAGRRVIVPELWGHGRSGPLPPNTRSPADLARQMLLLLDRLEVDRCVVIGSSVGGMWGAHLAAAAPDRVAGLVLMNSYLGKEPAQKRLAYAAMLDRVAAAGRVEEEIADVITRLMFAADVGARTPSLPPALRRRIGDFSAETLRQSVVPLGRAIFNRPNALDMLTKIKAPTLVVAGSDDDARPAEESRMMSDLLHAEQVVIERCGHTATLEQPLSVNAVLLAFLERLGWGALASAAQPTAPLTAGAPKSPAQALQTAQLH